MERILHVLVAPGRTCDSPALADLMVGRADLPVENRPRLVREIYCKTEEVGRTGLTLQPCEQYTYNQQGPLYWARHFGANTVLPMTILDGPHRNPIRLLLHVPVPWVFVLNYLMGVGLQFAVPLHVGKPKAADWVVAGGAFFLTGAVIAGWSWLIFHKKHTTTVPGKTSSRLVTWGPYRISRNPMYVGLILAYVGEALLLHQLWTIIVLPFTIAYVHRIVIPLEETRLREVFGSEYATYHERVRRWL